MSEQLTGPDAEVLIDGLHDDVAFVWVVIHLGLRGNPPNDPSPPSSDDVDAAFNRLDRLVDAGLVQVGHMEYIDGGPPGRVSPVKHGAEPLDEVKARVKQACATGRDWEWSCWVVNTEAGDAAARRALAAE